MQASPAKLSDTQHEIVVSRRKHFREEKWQSFIADLSDTENGKSVSEAANIANKSMQRLCQIV